MSFWTRVKDMKKWTGGLKIAVKAPIYHGEHHGVEHRLPH